MTVSSDVDLCNLSLDMLNVSPITSIENPETETEELMQRWYDQTRKQALRRFTWNFAAKRCILAPDSEDPVFGYSTQYTLPSDYIRILYINDEEIIRDNPLPTSNYTKEGNKILVGSASLEDSTQLRLVYISNFKQVTQMDALFIDYFSVLLAQNIAYKVTQSNTAIERVNSLMKEAETRAKTINGQENPPKRIERSRARRARRNVGGVRNYDGIVVFD